jgi:calcium-independent phospholipase A2
MDAFFQRRFMQFQSICSSWDMKNGGTPLNWATMKEVVISLVELGCRIDARKFSGHTALHVMVQRDRFECVVALLSCGANQNLVDSTGIF